MDVLIREERPEDRSAVYKVNRQAFETPAEADLVDALRPVADPFLSWVAVVDGRVVGHILFTPVRIVGEGRERTALGLAPMAVLPEFQNQGLGSRLVRAGLDGCRALGHSAVVVLGHAEYYPRFGFEPAAPRGLHYKEASFDPYFFVIGLVPGGLEGVSGWVEYLPVFEKV